MITYEVTLLSNGIYHSNLVKTKKEENDIIAWFKENDSNRKIIAIKIATSDSVKPGKPVIIIE